MKRSRLILLLFISCQVLGTQVCPASRSLDELTDSRNAHFFLTSSSRENTAQTTKSCRSEIRFSLEGPERHLSSVSANKKSVAQSGKSLSMGRNALKHSSEDSDACDFPLPKRGSLIDIALSFCPLPDPTGSLVGPLCDELTLEDLKPEPPLPPICTIPEPTRAVIIPPPVVIPEPPCFELTIEELPEILCIYPEPIRAEIQYEDIPTPKCSEVLSFELPIICTFPEPERAKITVPEPDLPDPVCFEVAFDPLEPITPSVECSFPEPTRAAFEEICEYETVVRICEEMPLKPIRIEPDEPDDCTPEPITPTRIPDDPVCDYPEPHKADFKFTCGEESKVYPSANLN